MVKKKVLKSSFLVGLLIHDLNAQILRFLLVASGGCQRRPAAHMVQITSNKTEVVYIMKTGKKKKKGVHISQAFVCLQELVFGHTPLSCVCAG